MDAHHVDDGMNVGFPELRECITCHEQFMSYGYETSPPLECDACRYSSLDNNTEYSTD